ncbi:Lar family restriction alleviation protein [Pseudomonas juntendi]|uniref:Lar family restriction alleviation protein n=1 Tax=Pseudomonas juntendi TaxID=2666183 RepID=UPI00137AF109|nr:Lar family restriction alleviation protein [Pseudomonas juntendi]
MISELLPCPFCGGKADSRCTAGPDPDWFVECTECLASAPVFNEDKLDGWNMRAQPAPQPHAEPIAWMVGTAIWWHKPGAEQDSAKTGEPMVPLGPCDSPSEIARLTAQFKDWQASHHRNYCKAADERDELRGQLEQARRLLHTASIRLANWLEPGDDPRKQIIAFLEDTAEPTGTEEQPGFELIGPQLLEWNRSLVQPCILIGHEYGVATKAMKLARQALSGKSH